MSGRSLEEETRYQREMSWREGDEQVRQTIYLNRKVSDVNKPRYHTRENHDYMMSKYKHCVYCDNGCSILEPGEEIKK
jgi:hypothetical protein